MPLERDPCVGVGIEKIPTPAPPSKPTHHLYRAWPKPAQSEGYTIGIAMMPLAASDALDRVMPPPLPADRREEDVSRNPAAACQFATRGRQLDSAPTARRLGLQPELRTVFDGSVMGWAILGLLDAQAVTSSSRLGGGPSSRLVIQRRRSTTTARSITSRPPKSN